MSKPETFPQIDPDVQAWLWKVKSTLIINLKIVERNWIKEQGMRTEKIVSKSNWGLKGANRSWVKAKVKVERRWAAFAEGER